MMSIPWMYYDEAANENQAPTLANVFQCVPLAFKKSFNRVDKSNVKPAKQTER